MEQVFDFANVLALWGSVALLAWGGVLCLQQILKADRREAAPVGPMSR